MRIALCLILLLACSSAGRDSSSPRDSDGDGFSPPEDCDDKDASIHPGAADPPYDGVDANCDGLSDFDVDGDRFDSSAHGGEDCDDTNPMVNPSEWPDCGDGVDNNCDGVPDCDWHPAYRVEEEAETTIWGSLENGRLGHFVAAGELTGDGSFDVVVNAVTESAVYLLASPAPGHVYVESDAQTTFDFSDQGLLVADLDLDGVDDLVLSDNGGIGATTDIVYIFHGPILAGDYSRSDADGSAYSTPARQPDAWEHRAVADMNADGPLDLILNAETGRLDPLGPYDASFGSTSIVYGPFTSDRTPSDLDVEIVGTRSTHSLWRSMEPIDFNADGLSDLVIGTPLDPRFDIPPTESGVWGQMWPVASPIPTGVVDIDVASDPPMVSPFPWNDLDADQFGKGHHALGDVSGSGHETLLVLSRNAPWN